MKIKEINLPQSPLNQFDLLGSDEIGLSKAFAFLLGKEPKVLYKFLHYVGISAKNTPKNFKSTSIEIEKTRSGGRTDIEIKQKDKYHIIMESKIGNNKIRGQRTKYLNSFDDSAEKKVLCFVTGINDFNKETYDEIEIYNISWLEIGDLLDSKEFYKNSLVKDFLSFIKKGYKMREQKEILVQDLRHKNEIQRYKENQVYRRDVVFGSPLYFAPYFTRKAEQKDGEGIAYLSKILGILSLKPKDIDNYADELLKFSDKDELRNKWRRGVQQDKEDKVFTYFFLDKALPIKNPLKKDGGIEKGRGKDWIAAKIPKNRCVSFQEFVKRIIESQDPNSGLAIKRTSR
jgi:hypothetical protein